MKLKEIIENFLKNGKEASDLSVDTLQEAFTEALNNSLENACLAHFNYAIQDLQRKQYNRIVSIIYEEVDYLPTGNKATVRYIEGGYIIYTIKRLEVKERRIRIAHELSHILISSLQDKLYNPNVNTYQHKEREQVANILSLLMIKSQSNFYKEKASDYIYDSDSNLIEMCMQDNK